MNSVVSTRPSSIKRILTVEEVVADLDVVLGSPGTMEQLGPAEVGEIGALCTTLDEFRVKLPVSAYNFLEAMYNMTFHREMLAAA